MPVPVGNISQMMEESEESEGYIFVGRMDNARNLTNVLKAIHFKDVATVFLSENGLKITVEDSKYVQASAFVQSAMFQEYSFKEENAIFKINLAVMLECLNIFGSSKDTGSFTALKMCYGGHGSPLKLMLVEDAGILTDCSIKTQEPEDLLDFDFSGEDVENKIIMKSFALKDAFAELDMTSDFIQILMSPDAPHFRISTFGYAGSSHADYPKDSDLVELFDCNQTQSNRYKTTLLKPSTKALNLSNKISIRMDKRGFLSMQYMILTDDSQICFVEFLCSPDEEEGDEIANRDEAFHRPSKDAGFWEEAPHVLGGRDLTPSREGGTWLAMTRKGKFGMLTNYRQATDMNLTTNVSNLKPRGQIVTNYVKEHHGPVKYINDLINEREKYSKFNVLFGNYDKEAGFDVFYGSNALQQKSEDYKLKPGITQMMVAPEFTYEKIVLRL
eukprot:Seg2683.2 transcript_id=Seg2683.2/GoldUCD/mRNA.D3Y31 product="Cell cycle checkpoint protein RAD1" protein_id=Seg2683.2/GoldUCD/D3Y31